MCFIVSITAQTQLFLKKEKNILKTKWITENEFCFFHTDASIASYEWNFIEVTKIFQLTGFF